MMISDADAIEAALADAGWRGGADALVAAWVDHQQAELDWEEKWSPDDRCRHILACTGGERLVLEWVSGDTWELAVFWPEGWGREHLSMRWREDLEAMAESIVRAGGPFGGPQFPGVPACAISCGRGRRLAGDVELRFELLREELAAYFFIARDGALNNLWVVPIRPDHLPAALDSLERTPRCSPNLWVHSAGKRSAWRFTAWRPLLARARVGARELLLSCPDASTAVILAHAAGRLVAAVRLEMRELPDFDAGAWLARAAPWPTTRPAVGSVGSAGSVGLEELPAAPIVVQAGVAPPPPVVLASDDEVPPPPPVPAGLDEDPPPPAALADDPMPAAPLLVDATREPEAPAPVPEPVEPLQPRFTLAPEASAEDIQRHFMDVEAAIPPRLTGAATAVELWAAIREAHKRGALPISGNWVDLVAVLHHRGFLPHLPSDRASRAALLILAKLSPLVRRLHHRRWAVGIPS